MTLKLYNTLTRRKEVFKPLKRKRVGLYTCGPTVYWFSHIGNLRTYIFEDILKRVLLYNRYEVKHVMNITDVGHLTSDADTGEDKIEVGAKREKKTVWEIAKFYEYAFRKDLRRLNIKEPSLWTRATSYIQEQIELIKILEKKGFTYKISDGIYFDSSKIKDYGKLTGSKKRKLKAGARVEMTPGKKNPTDFALWKFSPAKVKRKMEWNSPWGRGFPGWHTECVAMSEKTLGTPFDIHCGGIDHIPIHHTNEIAQSQAAFRNDLARLWLHGEFLILKEDRPEGKPPVSYGARMGKSEGNIVTVENLVEKDFNPLAYRYLCLTAHYRSQLNFSWLSLEGFQGALDNLYQKVRELKSENREQRTKSRKQRTKNRKRFQEKFLKFINDDLDTPKALALTWDTIKSPKLSNREKYELLIDFDKIFGLNLAEVREEKIPAVIKKMVEEREMYRQLRNWQTADEIRKEVKKLGYQIEDTKEGSEVKYIGKKKAK